MGASSSSPPPVSRAEHDALVRSLHQRYQRSSQRAERMAQVAEDNYVYTRNVAIAAAIASGALCAAGVYFGGRSRGQITRLTRNLEVATRSRAEDVQRLERRGADDVAQARLYAIEKVRRVRFAWASP